MRLSDYSFILRELKKTGYGVDTMTVKEAQEMADKFKIGDIK